MVNGRVVEDAFPGWNDALKKVRVEPYVSQAVEAANRRAGDRTSTDRHRSSYMQDSTDSSRITGGRSDSDNRNVTVNSNERSDQNKNTHTQQHDYNNKNNFSGSNSSDDEDDRTFYSNYVSRMPSSQHSERTDQRNSNYDNVNVNFSRWRDPNQPNNQPHNLSMRDYPPLTRQTGTYSYNGNSADHNMTPKHIGHVGSFSGIQGGQSTIQSNGTNEGQQQSRDVGGGDRGPK